METLITDKDIHIYNYDFDDKNVVLFFRESGHGGNRSGKIEISADNFLVLDFTQRCKIGSVFNSDGINISNIQINYSEYHKELIFLDNYNIELIIVYCDSESRLGIKYSSPSNKIIKMI